ncbi:MAG: 4-alpha-glucanotransferase [Oscillospiraceae bacterium]|nr:4-alpha-glucanotransferase [Oscillospiraceae bacterium]MBQ6902469.1 4-alpha-glucanotransferase [Oscillospiraceae bacterium]
MKRHSGVLMHISSLNGPYGIGTLGKAARDFCEFLKSAGFSAWQMLPINPRGLGFSPYNSISSFAGEPLFIDPEALFEAGLITKDELQAAEIPNTERVDFKIVIPEKTRLLRLAYSRFKDFSGLHEFCDREGAWLSDYASFMSIRDELGGIAWQHFPHELRNKSGLSEWREAHRDDENYYKFEQFMFFRQWESLRSFAKSNGISLIGDVPIYVALDSCDVWSAPEIFNLNDELSPFDVSGCPPDAFSADGQLWGNPTYRWDRLSESGFSWWIARLSHCAKLFDTVRLDHFRAFEAYWSVPYGAQTAVCGHWEKGPGKPFFDTVKKALPDLSMIAEDLGFLTDEVFRLRDDCGLPGMRVLQFAFDSDENNLYLPHKYTENSVVYTGTHDNDTLRGFIESAPVYRLDFARRYLNPSDGELMSDAFLRAAWSSCANLAIAPMQDLLGLPTSARMNTPSTVNDKNWRWRMREDAIKPDISEKFMQLNRTHFRI